MLDLRLSILTTIAGTFALLLAASGLAQDNGEVISLQPIAGFSDLADYIEQVEKRPAPPLDAARYAALSDIDLFGLTYWSDGLRVKGFLLKPRSPGPHPAVIYNRGGSRDYGSLTQPTASIQLGELARIARAGYLVVASQYRGNGGGEGQEEYMGRDLQDVLSLIDLLDARSDVDASRLGMFGWSRGGATTFRTLTKSRRIQAAAVGGPAVNYPRIIVEAPEMGEYWSEFVPGYHDDPKAAMAARSVLYWPDKLPRDVPLLIVHGAEDARVATDDILSLALKLEGLDIPYRLVVYEGGDHGLSGHRDEALGQVIGWFDRHLAN
ncbi:MAG: prolyl oligopeptidase family serine peptidase [Acidobacteriota bacterium]